MAQRVRQSLLRQPVAELRDRRRDILGATLDAQRDGHATRRRVADELLDQGEVRRRRARLVAQQRDQPAEIPFGLARGGRDRAERRGHGRGLAPDHPLAGTGPGFDSVDVLRLDG